MVQRARAFDSNREPVNDRGADPTAPRSSPLTMVSRAVAGDDLQSVASAAAAALGCPIAIAIPALGEPVVSPPGVIDADWVAALVEHATATISGAAGAVPAAIAEAVAVRIGEEVVGIVVAAAGADGGHPALERRAWLEAAAAAAAITALIRDTHEKSLQDSRASLVHELNAGHLDDISELLGRARRLGSDLDAGAVAICTQGPASDQETRADELAAHDGALLADVGEGRVLGLLPLTSTTGADAADALARALTARGMTVALSTPRRDPTALREALREAELLVELTTPSDAPLSGQEETYRLLIGVLLRDPDELELLRARTISQLAEYDGQHDTELLATLQAFLAHHGSTTETAEAMHLHRHTVGYRLSRVHEVSGLSPYESDGRERLSLGLKAQQILDAEQRRSQREQPRLRS
jgi:PucR C-terminal helix-turn-helix domain/GGDEF-like domain